MNDKLSSLNGRIQMSTTDRVTVYNKPCPCDEGKIIITECSPDHPYARDSQTWYEGKLDCKTCTAKYRIDESDNDGGRYIILMPYDENIDLIRLISIDRFCNGLAK